MNDVARLNTVDQRLRLELAEWLAGLARNVAGDNIVDGPMTRAVVVLFGAEQPAVTWHGQFTQRELYREVSGALREQLEPEGVRPSDLRASRVEHEAREHEAKPYECRRRGGCGARFANERGRDAHERYGERAQAAADAIAAEPHRLGCYIPLGSSHCRCGLWPADKRRPNEDYLHRHLKPPSDRPALSVLD